jgi:hypothetical protein
MLYHLFKGFYSRFDFWEDLIICFNVRLIKASRENGLFAFERSLMEIREF